MELKATYKQKHRNVVEDKRDYRQTHFHDYSVITSNIYLDEEYIKKLITEMYQQAEKGGVQPAYKHRLLLFLSQHYLHKVPYLHKAGAMQEQCNQVLSNFDEEAGKHFNKVNTRPLSTMQTAFQRARQLDQLRPEPLPQAYQQP
eukprot:3825186-Amphidinium_carterae.1